MLKECTKDEGCKKDCAFTVHGLTEYDILRAHSALGKWKSRMCTDTDKGTDADADADTDTDRKSCS